MKSVYLTLALAACALAQEAKFYRLDFAVKEVEDTKVVSVKKYSTFISSNENASIRTGTKVPYQVGSQHNYVDVGVNIDCKQVREAGGHIVLFVTAEISSLPSGEGQITVLPVVRQNKWTAIATVEPAKPTLLFSSDDLNSKRKLQLELTATALK